MKVIKKDNTLEAYNEQKIINACNLAANRVLFKFTDDDFEDADFGETISSGAVNPQSDDPLDEFLDGIF